MAKSSISVIILLMAFVACNAYVIVPSQSLVASKNFSFVPNGWNTSLEVTVQYSTMNYQYTHCCQQYFVGGRYINIYPLENVVRRPVEFRNPPRIGYQLLNFSSILEKVNHTLMMVDPDDIPKPGLHWLVINFNSKNWFANKTIRSYSGPHPADQRPHHYVFLLFRQNTYMDPVHVNQTVGPSRADFNVTKFAKRFNLTLTGLNWFRAQNDPWTNQTRLERDPSKEAYYCWGKNRWTPGAGCMTTVSKAGNFGVNVVSLIMAVALVLKSYDLCFQ